MLQSRLTFDSDLLRETVCDLQYFQNDIAKAGKREYLVDCGAYDGDTIRDFVDWTGRKFAKITAFEPDPNNFSKLREYVSKDLPEHDVQLINKGASDKDDILHFSCRANISSVICEEGDTEIEVTTIDHILEGDDTPVTMIKMDIEGVELSALIGAQNTIRKYRPMLTICIYHKFDDPIVIPRYLRELVPEYRFYIRNHSLNMCENVLYAKIP
jgi:FkbM family methyltransferase